MQIKIGKFNLAGDDWNQSVTDFDINWSRQVSSQNHFRAFYPKLREDGNQICTITFGVARLHDTIAASLIFQLDHGEQLPRNGLVEISEKTESTTVRRRFAAALCRGFMVKRIGVTTLHNYEIIGTKLAPISDVLTLTRQSATGGGSGIGGGGGSGTGGSTLAEPLMMEFTGPVWTWVHGLGFKPLVMVIDTNGNLLVSAVTHLDVNTLKVEHTHSTSGFIIIR